MELLTLTAIAEQLNISESTIRYYARKFAKVLPSVGEGRQKRYRPEAIEVLRIIAEMFKENRTAIDIFNHLSQRFPVNINTQAEPQQSTLTVQQQSNLIDNQVVTVLLQKITEAMDTIKIQHEEILQAKDRELEAVKESLNVQAAELDQAKNTISKARVELQKMIDVQDKSKQIAQTVIEQQGLIDRLRAENKRLRLPWWRRLLQKKLND